MKMLQIVVMGHADDSTEPRLSLSPGESLL